MMESFWVNFVGAVVLVSLTMGCVGSTVKAMLSVDPFDPFDERPSKWWVLVSIILWSFLLSILTVN